MLCVLFSADEKKGEGKNHQIGGEKLSTVSGVGSTQRIILTTYCCYAGFIHLYMYICNILGLRVYCHCLRVYQPNQVGQLK